MNTRNAPTTEYYIEEYLKLTDSGTLWTPQTYLTRTLTGRAKMYYSRYWGRMETRLRALETAGKIKTTRSSGGATAYVTA